MMMTVVAIVVIFVSLLVDTTTHGWMTTKTTALTASTQSRLQTNHARHSSTTRTTILDAAAADDDDDDDYDGERRISSPPNEMLLTDRRKLLESTIVWSGIVGATTMTMSPQNVNALVKGVAPPPPRKKGGSASGGGSSGEKCTNVEECQAMAEKREAELRAKEESGPPPSVTKGGVRYRDIDTSGVGGSSDASDSTATAHIVVAKEGDEVDVYYKVLKLGKRSYDGISGEATVVFSRGYGLEDDETKPGQKSFRTVVGSATNIAALNEAVVGMAVGKTRRFSITPQMGWEKAIAACDGGPGGRGTGGDLKTDYVVVPTATMVEQEACFDKSKQPFPATYAQQRRMAQRFDQSLIMEIQLVDIVSSSSSSQQK